MAAFGGAQRKIIGMPSDHPLVPKLSKAMANIEYRPDMDNRKTRRRNQQALDSLREGADVGLSVPTFTFADVYWNGVPGVPRSLERAMDLYLQTIERLRQATQPLLSRVIRPAGLCVCREPVRYSYSLPETV